MKIAYSPESIQDLKRLRAFIATKNPQAAQHIAISLRKGIQQLKLFPYLGVEVKRAVDPGIIRDLIVGNYTVRYLIRVNEINILRIWHHKEDL